jgi:hypothetical protein
MILRGAPSHCDGHGRCGFLSPAFYHWFIAFITSPFCFFRQGLDRTPPEHSISVPRAWPCVIGQNPIGWSHGLEKKGLACVSCERVSYVMDGLGHRGGDHHTGRHIAVFYSDTLCETERINAAHWKTTGASKARAGCPAASRVGRNDRADRRAVAR